MSGKPPAEGRAARVRAAVRRWLYPYAALAAVTFLLGAVVGAAAMAATDPAALEGAADAYGDADVFPEELTTWTVFRNNVVALGAVAAGAVSFGLAAAAALFFNGLLLGAVVYAGALEGGLAWTLALVVPHGVLELAAFFVVGGVAYRVTWRLVSYLRGTAATALTRREATEALALSAVAVCAIAVAAYIEANLTLPVARAVVGGP